MGTKSALNATERERLLWTEQVMVLTTALISASTALPALTDNGFISLLMAVLKLNPKNEGALLQRAKLTLRLGKCEEAEKDFAVLKSYAENAAQIFLKRAWCHYHSQQVFESIADTGKVLKLEQDNIEALQLRGDAYYHLGEIDTAINHYRKGLKFDPEHKGCKDSYKKVKKIVDFQKKAETFAARSDHTSRVDVLRKAIEVDRSVMPIQIKLHKALADALKGAKKFKEAKDAAEFAVKADDQD
eukprot:gene33559-43092_t